MEKKEITIKLLLDSLESDVNNFTRLLNENETIDKKVVDSFIQDIKNKVIETRKELDIE